MKGSFDLGNLSGVIMKKDQPVLRFAYKDGFLTDKEVLNASLLPFDMVDFADKLPDKLKNSPLKDTAQKGFIQLLPGEFDTDGFFIAKLQRKSK